MRSKFKGKYLEVEPLGITHLEFPKTGNHYTWRKVKTIVHNIVIGKVSHKPGSFLYKFVCQITHLRLKLRNWASKKNPLNDKGKLL